MTSVAMLLFGMIAVLQDGPGMGESSKALSSIEKTAHFEIRYRPGSRAGASVDRLAEELEKEYRRIVLVLGLEGKLEGSRPFSIFVYDDVSELGRITGVSGAGGFASGREVHLPFDNDQTRLHELVHVMVAAMSSTGEEDRNMFFVEGLSNAVLTFVTGVHVHAVAAFEKKRGTLPELSTLGGGDFYAYLRENEGFNGYDVGGSFMLHLLETYGPAKVMTFYHGAPIETSLGTTLEEVEASWHAHLDRYRVRPELEELLKERRGEEASFTTYEPPRAELPKELLEESGWRDVLSELAPRDSVGTWDVTAERAVGSVSGGGDWTIASSAAAVSECIARVKVKAGEKCWGVKLRYGDECQAMVLGQGSFIYYKQQYGVAFTESRKLSPKDELEIVLRIHKGRATVWIDGEFLLEAQVEAGSAPIGLGVVGGSAEFRELAVRPLSE